MVYRIAHELGISELEVQSWSISRIRGWMTFFQVTNELEREAMEREQSKNSFNSMHKSGKGY